MPFFLKFFISTAALALICASVGSQAQASEVKEHKRKYYGGGFILGKPAAFFPSGLFYQTHEVEILWGMLWNRSGGPISPVTGKPTGEFVKVNASIDTPYVFNTFSSLEMTKSYVFEFKRKYWLNPEIEESHFQIIRVHPLKSSFTESGLPMSMEAPETMSTVSFAKGTIKGRIIGVERGGLLFTDCTVYVNPLYKTRSGRLYEWFSRDKIAELSEPVREKPNRALMGYWQLAVIIDSEELCSYAENLMFYDIPATIDFTEDFIEYVDISPYRAYRITVMSLRTGAEIYEKMYEGIFDPARGIGIPQF